MDNNEMHDTPREGARLGMSAVIGVALALLACNVFLFWRVHSLETATSQWATTASPQISELRQAVASSDSNHVRNMEALRSDMEHQSTVTAGHAKIEAQKHAEQLAKELADQQQQQQQQVTSELSEIKQTAATTSTTRSVTCAPRARIAVNAS